VRGLTYRLAIDAADVADVAHVVVHLRRLVSEPRESVNDDTEDDVEEQENDDDEEGQVVDCPDEVHHLGLVEPAVARQQVADAASVSETEIQRLHVAVEEAPADVVTRLVVAELDVIVEVPIEEECEQQRAVDPQEDEF